jgi:putative endonuclease
MYYFYILHSLKTSRYYIGSCADMEKRLLMHNSGKVRSTKFHMPWKVVYTEKYNTLSEARYREYQAKSWKKRAALEKLINSYKF